MVQRTINILSGMPGSGKTAKMLDEMAHTPGRYLFAMPRTDLIEERADDLRRRTSHLRCQPTIIALHSGQGDPRRIGRRIQEVAAQARHERHVIVLITHEALTSTDLSGFEGWHSVIDETPDAVASGKLRIPVSASMFEALYELAPVQGTKWAKVIPADNAPGACRFMRDDFAADLLGFDKRARTETGVLVDVTAWEDVRDTDRTVQWWSAWSPVHLEQFETVTIAASGYLDSVCHLATEAWYPGEVNYHSEVVEAARTGSPTVRIHYYTRGHRGSTSYWREGQGKHCLLAVGRHLSAVADLGFWSGNEMVRERFALVPGRCVLPRQAGTNAYRHLTSCAMVYSSKFQDGDTPVLEAFGLKKADIERAREIEDIQQFIMRGAIRCPEYGGGYDVYLYDLFQAEAVRDFLTSHGITNVELVGLGMVGIMDEVRPNPGRKPVQIDPQSKGERDAEKRAKDADRKREARARDREERQRAGTYRGAGRPAKHAPNAGALFS